MVSVKIKNEAKGITEPKLDIRDYLDTSVDEASAWEELRADERKIQLENARIAQEWFLLEKRISIFF